MAPLFESPWYSGSGSVLGANGDVPDVLEAFSNSAATWFVAICVGENDGVLTVRFLDGGGRREKAARHDDVRQLAPFGTHIALGLLPPGFRAVPSSTRPGTLSYLDTEAQKKYASPQLAWQAYLERQLVDEGDAESGGGCDGGGFHNGYDSGGNELQLPQTAAQKAPFQSVECQQELSADRRALHCGGPPSHIAEVAPSRSWYLNEQGMEDASVVAANGGCGLYDSSGDCGGCSLKDRRVDPTSPVREPGPISPMSYEVDGARADDMVGYPFARGPPQVLQPFDVGGPSCELASGSFENAMLSPQSAQRAQHAAETRSKQGQTVQFRLDCFEDPGNGCGGWASVALGSEEACGSIDAQGCGSFRHGVAEPLDPSYGSCVVREEESEQSARKFENEVLDVVHEIDAPFSDAAVNQGFVDFSPAPLHAQAPVLAPSVAPASSPAHNFEAAAAAAASSPSAGTPVGAPVAPARAVGIAGTSSAPYKPVVPASAARAKTAPEGPRVVAAKGSSQVKCLNAGIASRAKVADTGADSSTGFKGDSIDAASHDGVARLPPSGKLAREQPEGPIIAAHGRDERLQQAAAYVASTPARAAFATAAPVASAAPMAGEVVVPGTGLAAVANAIDEQRVVAAAPARQTLSQPGPQHRLGGSISAGRSPPASMCVMPGSAPVVQAVAAPMQVLPGAPSTVCMPMPVPQPVPQQQLQPMLQSQLQPILQQQLPLIQQPQMHLAPQPQMQVMPQPQLQPMPQPQFSPMPQQHFQFQPQPPSGALVGAPHPMFPSPPPTQPVATAPQVFMAGGGLVGGPPAEGVFASIGCMPAPQAELQAQLDAEELMGGFAPLTPTQPAAFDLPTFPVSGPPSGAPARQPTKGAEIDMASEAMAKLVSANTHGGPERLMGAPPRK
eukprot:TRINITY_DN34291_c0_g1_i1.p1 TRINITY_DN34291_c0_g1~~TRINITY_DN34291_c0_g1_i1.p1  ORF type:complete len:900 (-),score=150.41 TRINITY_DN34291_c0_g1_i1:114-2813(-)